jgi:purine-binding chemotaxis protein CheW
MINTAAPASDSLDPVGATGGAQYLTFVCAGEEYGINIMRVLEIKGWDKVTRVPYAPAYVLGVMNLRGMIVPVINLRVRFNIEQREFDSSTVVIVVRVQGAKGEKTVGVVVDAVSEVYTFLNDTIKQAPDLGGSFDSDCISGIATVDKKMVMLLDIDALIYECVEAGTSSQLAS